MTRKAVVNNPPLRVLFRRPGSQGRNRQVFLGADGSAKERRRISSTILVRDSRTSSANGAFGWHERQDSAGIRLVTAASGWRSSVCRSIAFVVRQAGRRTHRYQYRAAMAAPIGSENSIGTKRRLAIGHRAGAHDQNGRVFHPAVTLIARLFGSVPVEFILQSRKDCLLERMDVQVRGGVSER
jgi:hypothetical protein